MTDQRCPCRKKSETTAYGACCGRFHAGLAVPETAEQLMRSRYAAFATRNARYLLDTWHVSRRPERFEFEGGVEWYMLKVHAHTAQGDTATVAFSARSRLRNRTHELRETSRFVREDGRWFYVDGLVDPNP
jgi:SEC-C motif domain protein